MKLRIFSVVGEALNFGGRRMETIARVAWLPVVLLLIVDMATVFSYLSVIAPQTITFAEVPSFVDARNALVTYAVNGWQNNFNLMLMITLVSLAFQTLLVASFMAPLVRLAGLGEEPGPGLIKIAFGPDQMRYILSSILSFPICRPVDFSTYGDGDLFCFAIYWKRCRKPWRRSPIRKAFTQSKL